MNDVAVIIPCYNLGRTLEDAVNSALFQTRAPAQIVVVDDGSDDPYTLQVLLRITGPRVRVVRQENRGVAFARNFGVGITQSEYLVLLDADDLMDKQYLEKAAAKLDNDPTLAYVSCAFRAFGEQEYVWQPFPCDLVELLARGGELHVASMWRRSSWLQVGGYDETLPAFEVWDFWISTCEKGLRGIVLDEPLLYYRMRSGSRSHQGLNSDTYIRAVTAIAKNHETTLVQHAEAIFSRKITFWQEQIKHQTYLRHMIANVETEIRTADRQIEQLKKQLGTESVAPIDWGDFNKSKPFSLNWGLDRGLPVDRYFIEQFLSIHRGDIQGSVLEIKDDGYTKMFGDSQVKASHVLDINSNNPNATIIADLTCAKAVETNSFDCIILTQTIHIIYDFRSALRETWRILKPGGILLCTLPAVSRINDEDKGLDQSDYWRFTEASVRQVFAEIFSLPDFKIKTYGNLRTSIAFLSGLAAQEISEAVLEEIDPYFPMLFGVRAVKSEPREAHRPKSNGHRQAAAILMYHHIADLTPDVHHLCVPASDFHAQMVHVKNHYNVLSLDDLVAAVNCGQIPDRSIVITFDDGYLDALEIAAPILKELNLSATFFINTFDLDILHEAYIHILAQVFLESLPLPSNLNLSLANQRLELNLQTNDQRKAAYEKIYLLMQSSNAESRREIIQKLLSSLQLTLTPRPAYRYLSKDEISRLGQEPGVTLGAHTVNHLSLPAHSISIQQAEIFENRKTLQGLSKQPVEFFSYPYGEYSDTTIEFVKKAGFKAAVSVIPGLVVPETNPWLLPRLDILRGPLSKFITSLDAAFSEGPVQSSQDASAYHATISKESVKIKRDAIVYTLTEHCNLKCYACDHAAPMFPEIFASYDQFVKDLKSLKTVFHSEMLRITGGEPLLHPQILDFLDAGKTIAIADKLVLVTNGTLLHNAPDKLWNVVDEIWLTTYPGVILQKTIAEFSELAAAHNVTLSITEQSVFFQTLLNQKNNDTALVCKIFELCKLPREWCCHLAYQGRFYKCAPSAFMAYRLKKLGIVFDNKDVDSVALHDNPNLFTEINRFIDSDEPLAACTYCLGTSGPETPHQQLKKGGIEAWLKEDHRVLIDEVRDKFLKPIL